MKKLMLILFLSNVILLSCQSFSASASSLGNAESIAIADPFSLYYKQVYGTHLLGPAISPLKTENMNQVQYFQNGKLVRNPDTGSISVAPLGVELGFVNPAIANQPHDIYEYFIPIYEAAGGESVIGRPLNGVQLNEEKSRLEQHFENFGLYQQIDVNSENPFGFLYYGVMACSFDCRYEPPTYGLIELSDTLHGPFKEAQSKLGQAITGDLLVPPMQLPNGEIEAIFENLVLFTSPENPEQVRYRPIMELMELSSAELVPPIPSDELIFYGSNGDLGHNVPKLFVEFLYERGGMSLSGAPISEIQKVDINTYHQYFQNICLEYKVDPANGYQIIIAPLGRVYLSGQTATAEPEETEPFKVLVWEEANVVSSEERQTLNIGVFDETVAQFGVQVDVTLHLPDGQEHSYLPPLTDASGLTSITLPVIMAPNLSLVGYEACAFSAQYGSVCSTGSFVLVDYGS